jgi:hypothetical protein
MSFLWSKKPTKDEELDKANKIWNKKKGKLSQKEVDEIEKLMEKREKKRGK